MVITIFFAHIGGDFPSSKMKNMRLNAIEIEVKVVEDVERRAFIS